jgi:hypothetical protein
MQKEIQHMRSVFRKALPATVAAVVVLAVGAGVAQAAVTGGPVWITKSGVLASPATKTITSLKADGNQTWGFGALVMTCTGTTVNTADSNKIIGGNPGTGEAHLAFTGCSLVDGSSTCNAKSTSPEVGAANEIKFPVKTLLGYKEGEKIPTVYEQFFPLNGGSSQFAEIEFGGSECGSLKGIETKIAATGTGASGVTGFANAHCGLITEVGKIGSGKEFAPGNNKELFKAAGLRAPATAIPRDEVWNPSTSKFAEVKCGLESSMSGASVLSGVSSFEIEKGEEFGVEA